MEILFAPYGKMGNTSYMIKGTSAFFLKALGVLLLLIFSTAQAFVPSNTQKITKDQQTAGLDATVTVDHRLLSEGGRNAIKEDFEDTNNHFNHELLQGTVEGIQAGSVGAVVDAVGRKVDLRHGIVAIQTDENSLTEQQLNAVNGKHSDADSKQQGMQSLSDRLTDQAGVTGQDMLVYVDSNDIAGGFHHDQSNVSGVNAAVTNMTDGAQIVNVVAHETTHHILNEQNNGYTGNQKEAAATKDGDYTQRLWEQQNTRNGHTTGGGAEDIASWNSNNQNSELIKTNTDRVAAIPAAERENLGPAIPVVIAVGAMIASDIKVANAPSPDDNLDNTPQSVSLLPIDVGAEILKDATNNQYDTAIDLAVMVGNPTHLIKDGADALNAVGGKNKSTSPKDFAASQQGTPDYPGVDNYQNKTLKPGDRVHQLEPSGDSVFYFDDKTLEKYGHSPEKMADALQVKPHDTYPPRDKYTTYEVTKETPAAEGIVKNNCQYGTGGGCQIVIPNKANLEPISQGQFGGKQ